MTFDEATTGREHAQRTHSVHGNPDYVAQVLKFGSRKWKEDDTGQKRNLKHKTRFAPEDVVTDGLGNIEKMPLLPGKPCFGRPERALRASVAARDQLDMRIGKTVKPTGCNACPVFHACTKVIYERMASNAQLDRSVEDWLNAIGNHTLWYIDKYQIADTEWLALLGVIISHGGWRSVNDANLMAASAAKAAEEKHQRLAKKRLRNRTRKAGASASADLSQLRLDSIELAARKRLQILEEVGQSPYALRWMRALDHESRTRIVQVWKISFTLMLKSLPGGATAISRQLHSNVMCLQASPASLRVIVSRDLKRIYELEHTPASSPIWPMLLL